ncbi:MAG: hypothetical protein ACODAU_07105 [Myxococcota bacterium]
MRHASATGAAAGTSWPSTTRPSIPCESRSIGRCCGWGPTR